MGDSINNEDYNAVDIPKKPKKNKGWHKLPLKHAYDSYHLCLHRWLKIHPMIEAKLTRYNSIPINDRVNYLAKPKCGRLLWLLRDYNEILSKERRAKLIEKLVECGYTESQLEDILAEDQRLREIRERIANAGPFDVLDADGNIILTNAEWKKLMLSLRKPRPRRAKPKPKKKRDDGMGYKRGLPGQLQEDWAHLTGVDLMLKMWAMADSTPDEQFISTAPEYYHTQAFAILQLISKALGIQIPPDALPTPYEQRIVMGSLNLMVWIAKNITAPAQLIQDRDIERMLSWGGETKMNFVSPAVHAAGSSGRAWTTKGTQKPEWMNFLDDDDDESELDVEEEDYIEGFMELAKCYDAIAPEFMYNGPREYPNNVQFSDGPDVSWILGDVEDMEPRSLNPHTIPSYFPQLLLPKIKETRPDPWYIVNQPEFFRSPTVKFATASNVELVGMVLHLVHSMVIMKDMSVARLLEDVADICQAIHFILQDDESKGEHQTVDDKRSIVLEQLFISFFSTNFRDFNDDTANYMRLICAGGANLIRKLYEHTAGALWELQSFIDVPDESEEETSLSEFYDELQYEEWKNWVIFLQKVTKLTSQWHAWLQSCLSRLETVETREELREEARKWLCIEATYFRAAMEMQEIVDNLSPAMRPAMSLDSAEEDGNSIHQDSIETLGTSKPLRLKNLTIM